MNICSDNHDEVCHESRSCPLCDMRDDLENQIEVLEIDLTNSEAHVDELEQQVE